MACKRPAGAERRGFCQNPGMLHAAIPGRLHAVHAFPTPFRKFPAAMRDARAPDLARLLELEALFPGDRLTRRQLRRHIASSTARLRVAEGAGCISGYALTFLRHGSAQARLYSLVVDPAARGSGLGAALVRDACIQSHEAGCRRLGLEVRTDNLAALALYQREGFAVVGRRTGYYADGCDAWRLQRELTLSSLAPVPVLDRCRADF